MSTVQFGLESQLNKITISVLRLAFLSEFFTFKDTKFSFHYRVPVKEELFAFLKQVF